MQQADRRIDVKTYKVRAVRAGKWWKLKVVGVAGFMARARRLDQVDDLVREPLAEILDVRADSFALRVEPVLDRDLAHLPPLVEEVNAARVDAVEARTKTAELLENFVREASDAGLSIRDTATILGVSHQYIAKIGQR
jgi:hypothetical protein